MWKCTIIQIDRIASIFFPFFVSFSCIFDAIVINIVYIVFICNNYSRGFTKFVNLFNGYFTTLYLSSLSGKIVLSDAHSNEFSRSFFDLTEYKVWQSNLTKSPIKNRLNFMTTLSFINTPRAPIVSWCSDDFLTHDSTLCGSFSSSKAYFEGYTQMLGSKARLSFILDQSTDLNFSLLFCITFPNILKER